MLLPPSKTGNILYLRAEKVLTREIGLVYNIIVKLEQLYPPGTAVRKGKILRRKVIPPMKKTFVDPELEVLKIHVEDILTESSVKPEIELPGMP